MSKAILLSIKPKYVADILNGKKTIEIRKQMPKCDLPIDVYIYCTKDNKQRLYPVALLDKSNQVFKRAYREDKIDNRTNYLNGKVVAKFTLRKVEAIDIWQEDLEEKIKLACLSIKEFDDYSKGQVAYAIHISNLQIFDKPKELSEFNYYCEHIPNCWTERCRKCIHLWSNDDNYCVLKLTKAPQSYCFVESVE